MEETFIAEKRGVTVTKSVELLESTEVQIGFRIESEWDQRVTVRVTDPTRDEWIVRVPNRESDRWSGTGAGIEYERDLEPGETNTTAYRVACENRSPDAVLENQSAPSLVVDAPETTQPLTRGEGESALVAAATDGSGIDDATEGTIVEYAEGRGNRDPDAELEEAGEFTMPDDEMVVSDLVAGSAESGESGEETAADDGAKDGGETTTGNGGAEWDPIEEVATAGDRAGNSAPAGADDPDAAVDALIAALEGEGSSERRDRLERALADVVRPDRSLEVQVARLQSRFEELAAYADALEEFIDENGTADEIVAEFRDELDDVQSTVETVAEDRADTEERLDGVAGRLDEVDDQSERLDDRIERLDDRVESRQDAVETDLRALEDSLSEVTETQQRIRERVAELEEFHGSVREAFRQTPSESI